MRLPNWDVELVKFCDAMRSQGLVYGFSDCVMFAAGAVEVQTGVELTREHRGQYSDEEGARAYMAEKGWADVDDVVDAVLPQVDIRLRRRGDILLLEGERGKTLGVCIGRHAMVLTTTGAIQIPSALCLNAWRVD